MNKGIIMPKTKKIKDDKISTCILDRGICCCQYGIGFLTGCNYIGRCNNKRVIAKPKRSK
jgi:ribose 5-phosphate isomerase RpiB